MTTTPFAPVTSPAQPPAAVIPGQVDPMAATTPVAPWGVPVPPPVQQPNVTTVVPAQFTQDDIYAAMEKARSEERDKLYAKISGQDQTLAELKAASDAREAAEKAARDEAAAAVRAAEEERMTAAQLVERNRQDFLQQLEERDKTWTSRWEEEKNAREASEATLQKERTYNEVREYAQQQIAANAENIAPQLVNWIQGNTPEEIDQAVARAIQTSNEILAAVQQTQQVQPGFQVQAPQSVSTASGPGNMDSVQQYTQLTKEQINAMSMAEYAKFRPQLLGAAGTQQNKGLYG